MQSAPTLGVPRHPDRSASWVPLRQPVRGLHRRGAVFGRRSTPDGAFTRIATLTPAAGRSSPATVTGRAPGSTTGAVPFVDVGNQLVTSTSAFSPAVLAKQSQAAIAAGTSGQAEAPTDAGRRGLGQPADRRDLRGHRPQPARSARARGVRDAADLARDEPGLSATRTPAGPSRRSLSRPAGRPSAYAPSRSGRPRCRAARGSGWRSRGTPPAPTQDLADRLGPVLALQLLFLAFSVGRREEDLRLWPTTRRPELPCVQRLLHVPNSPFVPPDPPATERTRAHRRKQGV